MATRARDPYSTPSPWYGLPVTKRGTLNLLTIIDDGVLESLAGVDLKVTLLVAQLSKEARTCVLAWRGYITKTIPRPGGVFDAHIRYGATTRVLRVKQERHGIQSSFTSSQITNGQLRSIGETQAWSEHGVAKRKEATAQDETAFWQVLRASPLVTLTIKVCAGDPVDTKLLSYVANRAVLGDDASRRPRSICQLSDKPYTVQCVPRPRVCSNFCMDAYIWDEDDDDAVYYESPLKCMIERFLHARIDYDLPGCTRRVRTGTRRLRPSGIRRENHQRPAVCQRAAKLYDFVGNLGPIRLSRRAISVS